ncbi:hypothetical protein [Candidatus Proelusimicrobium volucris]|uniref:hypothetical protein n=1 Tax=Candidatus Proelusimicrobium volucris TaxID=3416225 RepID=UPI003D0B5212
MKKIISICLSISFLCACGGMRGLQRQSTQNIHKTINENNEMYWNDKEGHTSDVKMVLQDENHSQIKIPVSYTVEVKNLDSILAVPSLKNENIAELQKTVGKCTNCTLDKEYLTIDLVYQKGTGSVGACFINVVWLPSALITAFADDLSLGEVYKRECAIKGELQIPEKINISETSNVLALKDIGVIKSTFTVSPKSMSVSCNQKSCSVIDENGKFVNKIFIHKYIEANQKRIEELTAEEKKAEAKRKAEEAKQKAEEAKRKAEENRKWRQKQRQQKKECPHLYRILYSAQQGYYVDPVMGITVAKRFDELDCGFWLNQQMNQAMY